MRGLDNRNEMNKSFLIKKIKNEDKYLRIEINEGFETSDNYLKINPNLIIGIIKSNNTKKLYCI